MLPVVINAIFCVIAWTFVFLICRAEKRAEAARKRTRRIAEEMLSPQHSAGRPVAGTTTGSSSPSTSSTSSPETDSSGGAEPTGEGALPTAGGPAPEGVA